MSKTIVDMPKVTQMLAKLEALLEAVGDEFDMDAVSDKLGRAMDAAQVALRARIAGGGKGG